MVTSSRHERRSHTALKVRANRLPGEVLLQDRTDPWLQGNLTLKANIEFASPPDAERYSQVLAATALDIDIASMPDGDQRRARSLSGGQKARLVSRFQLMTWFP